MTVSQLKSFPNKCLESIIKANKSKIQYVTEQW